MAYNFPYLKDFAFLKEFDKTKSKQQFVKITVLDFNKETPIQQIQGRVTGGNVSLDGSSSMRRTANISFIADEYENDLTTTKSLLSINKKVELLVGFKNTTNQYKDFDILWFPQGIYLIMSPSISNSSSGISISLTLHDKMALLNGECGGTLPASVILDRVDDYDEQGNIITKELPIYKIIQELVHVFGGEQLGRVLISDVSSKMRRVMKWTGSTPLYIFQTATSLGQYNSVSTNYDQIVNKQQQAEAQGYAGNIFEYYYGDDIGYTLTDFVYPTELIANAGDTVVTILDQIRDTLGNYQYFYDINGNFRFQQIKNYLNTTYSKTLLNEMQNYLIDYIGGKSVYTFEDADLVVSYSNAPQYQQIKNDFMVWGKKTTISGAEIPIRYHLAIDKKPKVGNTYQVFFYTDPDDGIEKAKKPVMIATGDSFPQVGAQGVYYYLQSDQKIYTWNIDIKDYVETQYKLEQVTTADFRTQLYMQGVVNESLGLTSNSYYAELKNEWPKLYNMRGQSPGFKQDILKQPGDAVFFLDFIDTPTAISEFSVQNIGRRTTVMSDDSINCVFEADIPSLVMIKSGADDVDQIQDKCINEGREYVLVRDQIYSMLLTGGGMRSAYDQIKKELYQYTSYNEQVSITAIPIYYLEPNTRITVRDPVSGIYGDYIIKSISLPLDNNGTMSISCTRAFQRG